MNIIKWIITAQIILSCYVVGLILEPILKPILAELNIQILNYPIIILAGIITFIVISLAATLAEKCFDKEIKKGE